MARGKYKQRKHNQDAAQLATDLAQVRAQLDEELARLATARPLTRSVNISQRPC